MMAEVYKKVGIQREGYTKAGGWMKKKKETCETGSTSL
jgi:hypothetical protein